MTPSFDSEVALSKTRTNSCIIIYEIVSRAINDFFKKYLLSSNGLSNSRYATNDIRMRSIQWIVKVGINN